MKVLDGREVMGRNEYARHRGDTPNAVAKAEASGRIKEAVLRDESGAFIGIDWKKADELWAHNTDADQAARNGKIGAGAGQAGIPAPAAAGGSDELPLAQPPTDAGAIATAAGGGGKDPHGLLAARAVSAKYQARQDELKYLETIGALVSTEDMKTVGARRYRALRDRLRAIPDRVSASLAAEHDQAQVHATLQAEIDRALYELSDLARAEAAGGAPERLAA